MTVVRFVVFCVLLLLASSAFADTTNYHAPLSGAAESPPNSSAGTELDKEVL
jgi:hypothetical protein